MSESDDRRRDADEHDEGACPGLFEQIRGVITVAGKTQYGWKSYLTQDLLLLASSAADSQSVQRIANGFCSRRSFRIGS